MIIQLTDDHVLIFLIFSIISLHTAHIHTVCTCTLRFSNTQQNTRYCYLPKICYICFNVLKEFLKLMACFYQRSRDEKQIKRLVHVSFFIREVGGGDGRTHILQTCRFLVACVTTKRCYCQPMCKMYITLFQQYHTLQNKSQIFDG